MDGKTKGSEWGGRVVSIKTEVPKVGGKRFWVGKGYQKKRKKREGRKQKVRAVGKKKKLI